MFPEVLLLLVRHPLDLGFLRQVACKPVCMCVVFSRVDGANHTLGGGTFPNRFEALMPAVGDHKYLPYLAAGALTVCMCVCVCVWIRLCCNTEVRSMD